MKLTIAVLAALVAVAVAAPPRTYADVRVLQENYHNNNGLGGYQYNYEQDDGQKREERAEFLAPRSNDEEGTMRVSGTYSYVDPADGRTYLVSYVADENGFRAEGEHLPVAPLA